LVRQDPSASITALEVKFSEAISSSPENCRFFSASISIDISGSRSFRGASDRIMMGLDSVAVAFTESALRPAATPTPRLRSVWLRKAERAVTLGVPKLLVFMQAAAWLVKIAFCIRAAIGM